MDAFDDGIRLEKQQAVGQAEIKHGAIITRADDQRGVGGEGLRETAD
jgi:hypothetical protein